MRILNSPATMACLVSMALTSLGCGAVTRRGYIADTSTTEDGTVITRMSGREIGVVRQAQRSPGKYQGNSICYLDARKCQHKDGTVTYDLLLTVQWTDTGALENYQDMSTRETLTLVIDGQSVRLRPTGDATREKDQLSHFITDSSIYPVSADVLRDLAGADRVDVSIAGEGGTLEAYLDNQNIAAFKRFWEENGASAGQSNAPKQ